MKKLILISLLCLGPVALYSVGYNPPANPSTENSNILPFDESGVVNIDDIFPEWSGPQLPSQEDNLTAAAWPTACFQLPQPGNPGSAKRKKDDTIAAPMGVSTQWHAGVNPQSQSQTDSSQTGLEEFNNFLRSAEGPAFQQRLAEALDEKFFAIQEGDRTASCIRQCQGCIGTSYVPSCNQKIRWRIHCVNKHLSIKDLQILASVLEKTVEQQQIGNNAMYKCTLCPTLNAVDLRTAYWHVCSQHALPAQHIFKKK